ncbi:hypothetical protein AB6D78_21535 [Vibrio splendidus]
MLDIIYLNKVVEQSHRCRLGEAENASSAGLKGNRRSLGKFAWTRNVDDVEQELIDVEG